MVLIWQLGPMLLLLIHDAIFLPNHAEFVWRQGVYRMHITSLIFVANLGAPVGGAPGRTMASILATILAIARFVLDSTWTKFTQINRSCSCLSKQTYLSISNLVRIWVGKKQCCWHDWQWSCVDQNPYRKTQSVQSLDCVPKINISNHRNTWKLFLLIAQCCIYSTSEIFIELVRQKFAIEQQLFTPVETLVLLCLLVFYF